MRVYTWFVNIYSVFNLVPPRAIVPRHWADKVRIIMSDPRILSATVGAPSQLLFLIVASRRGGCSSRRPAASRRRNVQERSGKEEP